MELVVGVEGGVDVAGVEGLGEPAGRSAHRVEVGGGEVGHRLPDRELVHGGDDVPRVARRPLVERADHRRPARPRDDEPALGEPEQRLAHGGAAHAEPGRELAVPELLAGGEGAVGDRVAQAAVDVVPQQGAVDRRAVRGNWHAPWCPAPAGRVLTDCRQYAIYCMRCVLQRSFPTNERKTMNKQTIVLVHGEQYVMFAMEIFFQGNGEMLLCS